MQAEKVHDNAARTIQRYAVRMLARLHMEKVKARLKNHNDCLDSEYLRQSRVQTSVLWLPLRPPCCAYTLLYTHH